MNSVSTLEVHHLEFYLPLQLHHHYQQHSNLFFVLLLESQHYDNHKKYLSYTRINYNTYNIKQMIYFFLICTYFEIFDLWH